MVSKIYPEASKVLFINKHTMLHVLEGTGAIEVDFKTFLDWEDKLIFLEKGQYIKFSSGDFVVRKVEFENQTLFQNKDFRVLFKHLVSLGYIHFSDCEECQDYLTGAIFTQPDQILDISSKQWYWQNPFNANRQEYHLIFDVKEVIDTQFKQHLSNGEIVDLLSGFDLNPLRLYTEKVGITVKSLLGRKRIAETQKEVAFTDKSVKEIAYDHGFKDPAYFNRVFKATTGETPLEFRQSRDFTTPNTFINDLHELIRQHHTSEHQVGFYADEMNLAVKTLSKKVKDQLHISLSQLIRHQLIKTAKRHLEEGQKIKEIARALHFEEPNHFTAFFKHYTRQTPSEYLGKKYKR